MSAPERHAIELEGENILFQRRVSEDGLARIEFSFDQGQSWEASQLEAYNKAKKEGKLKSVEDDANEGGEFATWLVELVAKLRALQVGESVKIIRYPTEFVLTEETVTLTLRGSALQGVEELTKGDKR